MSLQDFLRQRALGRQSPLQRVQNTPRTPSVPAGMPAMPGKFGGPPSPPNTLQSQMLRSVLTPPLQAPRPITARLNSLFSQLATGNPQIDVASGLLAGSGWSPMPRGFGESLAGALGYAGQRQDDRMRQEFVRRQFEAEEKTRLQQEQDKQTLQEFIRGLPLTPTQASALSLADPEVATREILGLPGVFGAPETKGIGESPIGKLFADLEAAEASGNKAAVQALQTAIKQEIAPKGAPQISFDDVRALRNDVKRDSGDFLQRQQGFQNVIAAAQDPSPAGDLALLFGVMKVLDPGSIVREGEVTLTESAGDLAQRTAVVFKRVFQGERLTAGQRTDFMNMARGQFDVSRKQHERLLADARAFAERHDLSAQDLIPEYLTPAAAGVAEYDYDPMTGQLVPRR